MATMKDIAREAGVSHGTVSNVLNKTGKVSIEKIRLVEEAAKKLGYVPNSQAQMLRQGSATTIALIIPSLQEDTWLDLYTTLQSSLKTAGYDVNVYTTDDLSECELSLLKQLPISNILAIVSVSALKDNMPGENPYHAMPCPVIFVAFFLKLWLFFTFESSVFYFIILERVIICNSLALFKTFC